MLFCLYYHPVSFHSQIISLNTIWTPLVSKNLLTAGLHSNFRLQDIEFGLAITAFC